MKENAHFPLNDFTLSDGFVIADIKHTNLDTEWQARIRPQCQHVDGARDLEGGQSETQLHLT